MKRKKKRSRFQALTVGDARRRRLNRMGFRHLQIPAGVETFEETPGTKVLLDIVPYKVTEKLHPDRNEEFKQALAGHKIGQWWYKRPYKLHRSIGVDNASIICPRSWGKECPICEERSRMVSEGADWKDENVRALNAKDRCLYVVVPQGVKDYDDGKPYLWDISEYLFQKKLDVELEEDEDRGCFPDPLLGMSLLIRLEEKTLGKNKFAETSRIDFKERDQTYDAEFLNRLPELDEMLVPQSYSDIYRIFQGSLDEEDEDENEDEGTVQDQDHRSENELTVGDHDLNDLPFSEPRRRKNKHKSEDVTPHRTKKTTQGKEEFKEKEKKKSNKSKKQGKNKCPSGYCYGADFDKFDECEDCEVWGDCMDESEMLEEGQE